MIQVVEPLLSLLGVVWGLELIRAFSIFFLFEPGGTGVY